MIEASSNGISLKDEQNVLIAGKGLTGFTGFLEMSDKTRRYLSIGLILLIGGLLGALIIRKIIQERKLEDSRKGVVRISRKAGMQS